MSETLLEFDQLPAVTPSYLRAVTNLSGGLAPGSTIPRIEAHIGGLHAEQRALSAYRKVCGFQAGAELPVTYPHVMAFPLHMTVMTHADFPLKLLGLVHVRNKITQHRPIGDDEAADLKVTVDGHREVHNGVEFDLFTEYCSASGEALWTGCSTMLSRGKSKHKKGGKKKSDNDDDAPEFGRYATWDAPADIGRRYALCAGDFNPIHMSALSAKLFGFPRAIAHGMWLKARTAAEITGQLKQSAYSMEVAFKRPVLLPSPVMLKYSPEQQGIAFALRDPDGETTHMLGEIRYL